MPREARCAKGKGCSPCPSQRYFFSKEMGGKKGKDIGVKALTKGVAAQGYVKSVG